ncbi:hypothetical protein GWK48_10110 [Metallosphaera tengchongensis]|uniref:Uncharacterized protein n=1 Tax=Metallosphaera tengchongensis TaxID=1532350 RepID=A0A6N0NV10_9CREN|nr:hypothetical protein [Metallosphaera tengchongensis]QKR00694.1 hypothetical protein GWK48_10110 [Metallosphaera tengchongensis]
MFSTIETTVLISAPTMFTSILYPVYVAKASSMNSLSELSLDQVGLVKNILTFFSALIRPRRRDLS